MSKVQTCRLDKLLSSMGYGSRIETGQLARNGRIRLDGMAIRDGAQRVALSPDLPQRLSVDGQGLDPLVGMVILMHKPLGMSCSHKENGALVYDLLPRRWRSRTPVISTVGRLDKQTSGLLLLTDDGALLHRMISPRNHVPKTYRARLDRPLAGDEGALFASGQMLLAGDDKPLAPAVLHVLSETEVRLTVTEGRYHQVRRMFAAVGNHVLDLHRESMGGLSLPENMAPGDWKLLQESEIARVFE